LVLDVEVLLDESRGDLLVHVGDSLGDTYNHAVSSDKRPSVSTNAYPCQPTCSCHHHGARKPRGNR
jgi:hypothetical protein